MSQQHLITPPPELVKDWARYQNGQDPEALWFRITTLAAQWGADQELEACLKWMGSFCATWTCGRRPEDVLRAVRRPKPPSLKEQALAYLEEACLEGNLHMMSKPIDTIRRALEALND